MKEEYPKVGEFVAYYDPSSEKHTLGVITEIAYKYPVEMPEMASYTIFWTQSKRFVPNCKPELVKRYKSIFDTASASGLLNLNEIP